MGVCVSFVVQTSMCKMYAVRTRLIIVPPRVCLTLWGNKGTLGSALYVQGRDGCVRVFCRADVYVQDVCGAYESDNCSPAWGGSSWVLGLCIFRVALYAQGSSLLSSDYGWW